jgi:hypothetical protein
MPNVLPSLAELKEDIWDLANITYDASGFGQAETIFNKYRQVFDATFPYQIDFSDQTALQIQTYKQNAKDLDPDDCVGLVHLLISTILQQYSSVKRGNLELFGKEGRSIINQAPMDREFFDIIKKMNEQRSKGAVSGAYEDQIKETVGGVVVILSTATRDTKPAPDLYHRIAWWHNDIIDLIIRDVGEEKDLVRKQGVIKGILTDKLGKLWSVLGMTLRDESKAKIAKFSEEISKADIISYKRKVEGEGARKAKKLLNRLGASLGLADKDSSFSDFMKHQYKAVTILAKAGDMVREAMESSKKSAVPTTKKETRGPVL